MKVEMIKEYYASTLEAKVNEFIEGLDEEYSIIKMDYQMSATSGGETLSVMIVYVSKKELRNIKLNTLLDENS